MRNPLSLALLSLAAVLPATAGLCPNDKPCLIRVDSDDLQTFIDAAPPYSTLLADRGHEIEVAETIRVTKPLTITGLKARLKSGVGNTHLLEILAEGVTVTAFTLTGNIDSVAFKDRASLITVRKSRFRVEDGIFYDSARDGVLITPTKETGAISHGVVRDIIGVNIARDTVSIGGGGKIGLPNRHILVENIRCFRSRDRGAVEVSDGSEEITVRDVYSESSLYGVDVQDHRKPEQINRHVLIDGVRVKDCATAIRTANADFGHDGLTIRNVSGEQWRDEKWRPLHIKNTKNLLLENVRIYGAKGGPAIVIENSDNVIVRDISFLDAASDDEALLIQDANHVFVDNVMFMGAGSGPRVGVAYRITQDEAFEDLRIRNVQAPGVLLENASQSGSLRGQRLTDNEGEVIDRLRPK